MWSNWYGQRPEQQGEMVRLASSEAPYVYLEEGGSFSCDFSVRRTEGAFETKILLDCPRPELLLGGYEDATPILRSLYKRKRSGLLMWSGAWNM